MQLELAPMEGITTYVYRNALNRYFGGIDTYFSPFISVHKNKRLNFKEKKDILPENNKDINLIPQVMASDIEEFLFTSGEIRDMGYEHINFNFGCPSGTVTSKGKGSGALIYPDKLEAFLDGVFSRTDFKVSVKTRIGYSDASEWPGLLSVYSKFPLEELIIHGRVREEFYKGKSRMEYVAESIAELSEKMKVSYNGDIFSTGDYERLCSVMPDAYGCMLGRGIISNPALARNIKSAGVASMSEDGSSVSEEGSSGQSASIDMDAFISFNLELLSEYERMMSGDKNCLLRLKELWSYMSGIFKDSGKVLKKIQKTKSVKEYEMHIQNLKAEDLL